VIIAWSIGVLAWWAGPALAVDGVIEINQDKMVAAGGPPFFINVPGSYRLTSDLTLGSSSVALISILTSGVTIDLNGFSLVGPGGSGSAISAPGRSQIAVHDGQVRNFSNGITAGVGAQFRHLRLTANSNIGLACGEGCSVSASFVSDSTTGITAGLQAVITENVLTGNALGIRAGGVITGNSVVGVVSSSGGFVTATSTGIDALRGLVKNNQLYQQAITLSCHNYTVGFSSNTFDFEGNRPANNRCISLGGNLCGEIPC